MSTVHDVVVLGAGPAGSSCARRAAELGLRVTVLEKTAFPRSKPCAAGLTDKALRLFADEVAPVEHRRLRTADISFGGHLSLIVTGSDSLVVTTTRREFDEMLVRSAESAGAVVEFGRAAAGLEEGDDRVEVRVGTDLLASRYVVVADGARGPGREMLGLSPLGMGGGCYVRARPSTGELSEADATRLLFDPTASVRGYGWVFPKRDHLNVGIFSQRGLSVKLRNELEAFLELRGLDGWVLEGPYAFPVPVQRPADALGTRRSLCAGDAAGLVNPITGEGISSAVLSGRLAAEAVAESLVSGSGPRGDDEGAAATYARRVAADVLPMTDASRKTGNLVYDLGPGFLRFAARTPVLRSAVRPAWWMATRRDPSLSIDVIRGVGDHGG